MSAEGGLLSLLLELLFFALETGPWEDEQMLLTLPAFLKHWS